MDIWHTPIVLSELNAQCAGTAVAHLGIQFLEVGDVHTDGIGDESRGGGESRGDRGGHRGGGRDDRGRGHGRREERAPRAEPAYRPAEVEEPVEEHVHAGDEDEHVHEHDEGEIEVADAG